MSVTLTDNPLPDFNKPLPLTSTGKHDISREEDNNVE